mmetsp:Transcript_3240/g.7573  ORF Transcript_3240/g.7573 Transcript_3240/m.7573 type:complete len:489 (+) Transcript_3240:1284-2750(+)
MVLLGAQREASAQLDGNGRSNAKVVVVYTPPTQEECEAIANGVVLDDQLSLIHKSFYIHYDITLASEDDLGPLFSAMLGYIQEKLIPIMAGCGAIDFFGTTIPVDDELKNATNSIVNGQIEKELEPSCNGDSNGNCRSYILILDLYLKKEQSSATLIEVIGNALNNDETANALGSEYSMEVANVTLIEPSTTDRYLNVTVAPTAPDLVVAVTPTQAPTLNPLVPNPTATPTMGLPLGPRITPGPTKMPTLEPTNSDQTSSTNVPSRSTTSTTPSRMVTPILMEGSTNIPTINPTRRSTYPPTLVPTKAPTGNPTRRPTRIPSDSPIVVASIPPSKDPSKSPTEAPSSSPSVSTPSPIVLPTLAPTPTPTKVPSLIPSKVPTPHPSGSPTSHAPSPSPSKVPTTAPTPAPTTSQATWCCSLNYLNCDANLNSGSCGNSQFNCEISCSATWIQHGSCSGLPRWSECTNNVSGCCPPAMCTNQGPGYKQCI